MNPEPKLSALMHAVLMERKPGDTTETTAGLLAHAALEFARTYYEVDQLRSQAGLFVRPGLRVVS